MRNFLSGLWPIVVGLTIGLIGVNFVASPVTISGDSMQPNLQNNQIVMVNKQGEIKRGEVVVFNAYGVDPNATTPDEKYIKRIIGVPGDTVSDVNGVLRVNGKVVDQSFISENEQVATNNRVGDWTSLAELGQSQNWQGPISGKVPAGYYFVLGDHRSISNDSRYWGFVPKNKISGTVWAPPFDNDATEVNKVSF
ncbi:signal peptidase I [Weissella confusa]|uniref:signal peptidase I n=1 Tax=Weissella confusa TaxID=1583 RepID=UPI000DCA96F9|nr:signal peptidase I [Weissella confusa]MBD1492339.1 signal peptidase I [Weissella confusa]MBD5833183.1 signal peptidase I [Weissella confusa]MBF7059082.1 signal peptidase I [Weissella confusa]MBJ7623132.1 signal peptidase I [Weissella confusa]MBJ7630909.1 signal peptidase I [Weissella confusa]